MLFFNNNLAMGEPIILESLPNTRPLPTKKFIVPEHIVGTKNLFIFVDGVLQRNTYIDISWNTIEFNTELDTTKHIVSILFTQGALDQNENFYKLFLEGEEGQVVFNNPNKPHGVENDYTLTPGHYIEDSAEFDWTTATDTDFQAIFNTWEKFSHGQNGLFPSNSTELDGWQFINNRIISTTNSTTFIGWVTPEEKIAYNIQGKLKSTSTDDDAIAIVIAFKKINGVEYTLSAVRNNEDFGYRWALVYNFRQPTEWVVANGANLVKPGKGSWANCPNGVFIKAEKTNSTVRAFTSEMDSLDILPDSMLEISLTSDDRLLVFTQPTQSGYGCFSQQNSTFEEIDIIQSFAYNMLTHTAHKFTPATGWLSTQYQNIGEVLGYGRFFYNPTTSKLFYTSKNNIHNIIAKPLEWRNF